MLSWWSRQGPPARVGALAAAGVALGLVVGALLAAGGGGDGDPPAVVVRQTQTPAPTPTTTPAPEATATRSPTPAPPTPEPTPGEEELIGSIAELVEQYGEPPDASRGRFRIPILGVDAPLGVRQVGSDGKMPNPSGPADVVWYDFEGFGTQVGGATGGGQNAIYSAHVDYFAYVEYADARFRGRGAFYSLGLLSPGDVIEVEVDGETFTYAVQWRRQVSAVNGDWAEIFSADVAVDSITLITCGGDFNYGSRQYADRMVVRAERI